jgi:hypothetical protein
MSPQQCATLKDETGGYPTPEVDSCLPWFQPSPLAATSRKNPGHITRLDRLDIELEQQVMHKVFDDAPSNTRVNFEIGTADRLGNFFQNLSRKRQLGVNIHISCHGEKDYLAFEDGWGTLVPLTIPVLKGWIQPVSTSIHFVFVAACKSSSFTQAAVIEAGVKHAICAFSDETELNSSYVLEFSKIMYSALLSDGSITLQQAFDLATTQLALHPCFQALEPQLCLLPRRVNHQVPVFGPQNSILKTAPTRSITARFPEPPSYFVRHDIDVWKILRELSKDKVRIVWVTGANKLGKTTVVKAVCLCLKQRLQTTRVDGIVWKQLHADPKCCHGSFSVPVSDLESIASKDRNMIVVLDTKHLPYHAVKFFVDKMSNLMEATNHIQFLIIHPQKLDLKLNYIYRQVQVSRLGLESTIKLFARFCDHVNQHRAPCIDSPESLWRQMTALAPMQGKNEEVMLKLPRYRALYKGFGNGYPAAIIAAAKAMSSEDSVAEYFRYVSIGYSQELDERQSRCALLCHKLELLGAIYQELHAKRYGKAKVLQVRLGTVSLVLEEYERISTLQKALETVREEFSKSLPGMAQAIESIENKNLIEAQIQRAATFIVRRQNKSYSISIDVDFCCQTEEELEFRLERSEELVMRYHLLDGMEVFPSKAGEWLSSSGIQAMLDEDFEVMLHLQSIIDISLDKELVEVKAKAESQAATCVQTMARSCLARARVVTIRQRAAAVRIQRWMRNYFWIQSIVRVQARIRGVLYRIDEEKPATHPLVENVRRVQLLMSSSLRRLRCRREITNDMLASMHHHLSQPAVAIPKDIKTDADVLLNSIHTATTAPSSELSSAAPRSIRGGVDFVRNVSFRVQDRWKAGGPPREVQLSKAYGDDDWPGDDDSSQASDVGRSRWLTGTSKHELLIPRVFR